MNYNSSQRALDSFVKEHRMRRGTYLIMGLGLCFTIVACRTPDASVGLGSAVEIPFIVADGFGTHVTIHKVSAVKTSRHVLFLFDYSNDEDRNMVFFDPPSGAEIPVRQPLPAGDKTAKVRTTTSHLKRVRHIALGFYPLLGPRLQRRLRLPGALRRCGEPLARRSNV